MANFIPSLNDINNNKMEKPTEGEWYLLQQLKHLDDSYIIYFQPYINLAHPDIVIVKEKGGVMIIEVKDWDLRAYEFNSNTVSAQDKFGVMFEKSGHSKVRNPFDQVQNYKDELYSFYSLDLFLGKLKNRKVYGLVRPVVFFYKATEYKVKLFFGLKTNEWNYVIFWAKDSNNLLKCIYKCLNEKKYFTNKMYQQINNLLKPSLERMEQAKPFSLSENQKKYAISKEGKRQKIKGIAGSGKTLVLAQRAVNCYRRTKSPVLIITYNITLQHYIRDKISQITRDNIENQKCNFNIIHIFEFVKQMLDQYNIYYNKGSEEKPEEFIMKAIQGLYNGKQKISKKYKAILIDEVQDFKIEWLNMVEDLFLERDGEFVLFGDEKQNIYNRDLDENQLPRTRIRGPWCLLKENYRCTEEISKIALLFQKKFFQEKYEIINIKSNVQSTYGTGTREEAKYYDLSNQKEKYKCICSIIKSFQNEGETVSPNDICVLSSKNETLRELQSFLLNNEGIETTSTCESKEEYNCICNKFKEQNLALLRRIKRNGFWMNEFRDYETKHNTFF